MLEYVFVRRRICLSLGWTNKRGLKYKWHFSVVVINFVRSYCVGRVGRGRGKGAWIITQSVTFLTPSEMWTPAFTSKPLSSSLNILGHFLCTPGIYGWGVPGFLFPVDFWFCAGAIQIGLKLNLQVSEGVIL